MSGKRLLGFLMTIAFALAVTPGLAFAAGEANALAAGTTSAADETHALAAGATLAADGADEVHALALASDRHDNTQSIAQAMTGMPDTVEYVSLVGDMVGEGGGTAPEFFSQEVLDEVLGVGLPKVTFNDDQGIKASDVVSIVWADHDGGVKDDSGIVFANEGTGSGLMKTAYNEDGSVAYYVYGIAFYEMKEQAKAEAAAKDFESWVDTADQAAPVIVLCHMPLHYARGDNKGAEAWNKALNYAATGFETTEAGHAIVRNVFYSFGHNHTTESKTGQYSGEFYIPCNAEMEIGASKNVWSTIYYTYATAGYLNQNTTATLLTIQPSAITVDKYQEGEVADGVYDTESKKSGKFASVFCTAGTNRIARVQPVAVDFPEGCTVTLTDLAGGTLELDKPGSVFLSPGKARVSVSFATDDYTSDTLSVTRGERVTKVSSLGNNEFSFTLPRGETSISLTVKPRIALDDAQVTGIEDSYTFTGQAIVPEPSVVLDGTTLEPSAQYKVICENNVNAGTATLIVEGIGDYKGSIRKTFAIEPAQLSDAIMGTPAFASFTGASLSPLPGLEYNGRALVAGKDFTVTYKNNIKAGTGQMTIIGKGNFTGQLTSSFQIAKGKNTLSVKGKAIKVKSAKLKTKAQKIKAKKLYTVKNAQGKVTYAKANKAGKSKIAVNKKTGAIKLKKGLKKGLYKVKVKVTAAGNANYLPASKEVVVKVKVS